MSKVTAPLLSFSGSGQIAKTQVYSSWRGIPYARRYVIPANPRSSGQTETRTVFSYMTQLWKLAGPLLQAPWTAFTKGRPLTNRNAFIGQNVKVLRGEADNDAFIASPGAAGGIVAAGIAAAVAGTEITITLTAPELPDGWAITAGVAVATLQQDPSASSNFQAFEGSDAATPYEITLDVLTAGTYVVAGWFTYSKADGSTAYGPALSTTAVVA